LLKADCLAEGIKIMSLDLAVYIINQVVELNQKSSSLKRYHEKANKKNSLYILYNNLLLYKERLVVPVKADETLLAQLIKKAHA
jgi:hypothetical protein